MHRFWWPSYGRQLLGELQRQQNSAQFCDTLLQTEGISVPTHSCVLAALSPYLSQRLAVSPYPPFGHKRQLQLQAVNAQTLLKLVGLLYSGELVVKGSNEQNEVMAAAHQFGITDLVEGQNEGVFQENLVGSCSERHESLKMQDAQIQVNMAERGYKNSTVKKKSCVSIGTQTACEKSVGHSGINSGQNKLPNPEPASQSLDFSFSLQPQNITFEQQFSFTTCPNISRDAQFTLTNPTSTSALSSETGTLLNALTDDSQRAQEDNTRRESSKSGVDTQVFAKGRRWSEDGRTNGKTPDNEGNAEQPSQVNREGILRQDSYAEKSCAPAVGKNVDKMKRMMETAQISIKVKLRRRTNGDVWEVVNMQEQDDTSILKPLKQKPEVQNRQAATANSPKQLKHPNTTSGSQSFSSGSFTSNQSSELSVSALLRQPQGSVEESDEQIERLLEDIMMGLNILPSLESDGDKSQPSHDGAPDVCQIPGSEPNPNQSRVHAGCVFCQDLVTPSGHSSTDTAVQCCFAVQNQPSCTNPSAVHPDALIPQQCSPQYNSSVSSLGQSDEIRSRGVPTSKNQYTRNVLEFLPQSDGSETQSFCLPCMDDLRLPRCLSPLESCTPATKHQPLLNTSANPGKDNQQQLLLDGRPWLTENPASLQFPLSTITYKEKKAESQPQDEKQCRELNATNGTTSEDTATSAGEMRANLGAELKSDPKMMKESLKHKHDDAKRGAIALRGMKRKYTNIPQDAARSFLAHRNSKFSDGAKNFYSVSLLSDSSDMPCRLSSSTEGVRRRSRRSWDLTAEQTRIRTRGFVKKCQEMVGNGIPANFSALKPTVCRATFVNDQGVSLPKRRCRRPRKMKLEENPADGVPAIIENKSDSVKSEFQKEEEDETTKRRCREWRRNQSGVDPLKNALDAECAGKAEADGRNRVRKHGTPKRPRIVSLKEFQKLIKQQHSKIRKYIESQERSKPGGGEVSEAHKAKTSDEAKSREKVKAEEDLIIFNMTEDKNNNQMPNVSAGQESKTHRRDTNRSKQEKTSLLAGKDHPVFSCALDKGMVKLSAEEKEPLKNPDGGVLCGGSVSMPSAVSSESSHSDTHLFQESRASLDQNLNPQSSKKTKPLLSEADRITKTSGCGQGQEEEEEEEVDVLLYSPDKAPQTRVCEESVIMDVTPDEEEEEDVDVIDVTEDDAE